MKNAQKHCFNDEHKNQQASSIFGLKGAAVDVPTIWKGSWESTRNRSTVAISVAIWMKETEVDSLQNLAAEFQHQYFSVNSEFPKLFLIF